MSRLTIEKPFALIMNNGTIRMADKTEMQYRWMDVEYVMKNVSIYIYDDHIMLIEGIKAERHWTDTPLYLDEIPEEEKKRILPTKLRTSFWKNRKYISGTYGKWEDHVTKIYTKLENYKIVIEP